MKAFFKLSAPRLFAVLMVALACLYVSSSLDWHEEPTGGYALADLYDPGGISVYPITEGAEYDIRGYEVMVSGDGDDLRVTVNGYYK